jgi:hypothetical protein
LQDASKSSGNLPELKPFEGDIRGMRLVGKWHGLSSQAIMLQAIALILIILWLLGMVSSYTMGGFIHILLVIAIVVILIRLIQGSRV